MTKKIAHLMLLFSAFLWGVNFISMKYLTEVFPTFSLIFLRFLISTIFLWSLLFMRRSKNTHYKKLERLDIKSIVLTSCIGIVLYFYFQLFSFKFLSANMAALLCALIPIFSIPAEAIYHKKMPHPATYILSAISLYGVYLVLNMSLQDIFDSNAVWGILLMVLCNLSWVTYTLITGNLQAKYDSLPMLTYQSTVAMILFGICALSDIKKALTILTTHADAMPIIANLLFIGIGSSALAYLFYIDGMKVVGIQLSSLYMNIIPVITAVTSYLIFNTSMDIKQLIGMLVVISSIILINIVDQQSKKTKDTLDVVYDH